MTTVARPPMLTLTRDPIVETPPHHENTDHLRARAGNRDDHVGAALHNPCRLLGRLAFAGALCGVLPAAGPPAAPRDSA